MKTFAALLASLLVAACAGVPAPEPPARLYNDHLFASPSAPIWASDVFAVSPKMKHYINVEIAEELRQKGRHRGLADALYKEGDLKLEYDAAMTRNAAQAFDARAGNCLSLVIMTAAFAKYMGLPVRYQNVFTEETWSRSGDMYLAIGHVNLTLGARAYDAKVGRNDSNSMLIDFLPSSDARYAHTWTIPESTILAMYMNNRAVESLAAGRIDDAYWYAREAIEQDPRFMSAYNTLGVVYERHGNLREATNVFTWVLDVEPGNTRVLANLAAVLETQGKVAEARTLTAKLKQLEPVPPFSFFKRGMAAMDSGDYTAARDYFAKEVDRAAYYHEFHFWLAAAYARLGDIAQAKKHMQIAMQNSTTRKDHDLYAAKLDRIKAVQAH
jgi:Tfp pilus assembly protein PilF